MTQTRMKPERNVNVNNVNVNSVMQIIIRNLERNRILTK